MATLTAWNKKDIKTIIDSEKFDLDFYFSENPDVKKSGLDPIVHYVLYGCQENRNPNENFNTEIYYNLYKNVIGQDENPFAHYIRNNENLYFFEKGLLQEYGYDSISNALNRLKKYPFFSSDDYLRMNADISSAKMSPVRHALLYGIGEGREIFSKRSIVSFLGKECKNDIDYKINKDDTSDALPKTVGVFYHSEGNSFIKELAECLDDYLKNSGINSRVMTEDTPEEDAPELCIFCAPHEFFFLSGNETWKKDEIIKRSIMFNTEQPQTLWFTRGIIYIMMSAGVMDLCYQNLKSFSDVGLNVFHFDPPVEIEACALSAEDKKHPLFRVLPQPAQKASSPFTPINERSIDVSFFGNASRKREKFFSRAAAFFADYQNFLYYRKADGPIPSSGLYDILSRLPRYVSENSKISLNIHRDDNCFFEWHRIVKQGMASGSIIVTEECFPHPLYKNGEHYLTETPRHMPNLIEWLIRTEEGQAEAARIQKNIFDVLQNEDIFNSKNLDLKKLYLFRVEQPEMSILKPWAPAGNVEFSFKKKSRKPKDLVTVCVTNFNYAAVICECLDSIVDQTHENIDLVVVDDLSERDESIAVITEWMEENKQRFYRATLIQNKRNQGPSFSRNVAFENALGEAVFIMDADNTVYPKALEKTYAALINGGFPAVYTQIEEFGDRKGIGHADIWDPARMKQNNYVDVMALIRKDAWARVGGFCHIEEGWEDYDFWLKFIDCDLSPGYLPEILCRYRVHNTSRTATEALSAHYDLELVMEFRHPSPQKES